MKKLIFVLCLFSNFLTAQDSETTYAETIEQHRDAYKQDFLKNQRAPLKQEDLAFLRFYDANEKYKVTCSFKLTPDEKPFELPTFSGITKPYRKYGELSFEIDGQPHQLAVYQSLRLINMPQYKDHLFLPFRDLSNDETTYGGGRYIDLTISEIQAEEIILDFNKCYNPWCGYSDGYNCPIPPTENHLEVAIHAGEKTFAGEKKHK